MARLLENKPELSKSPRSRRVSVVQTPRVGEAGRARERVVGRRTPGPVRHNDPVTDGRHAGSRRGPRRQASLQPKVLLLALAMTLAIVAWGYLVYLAIDFGTTARGGDGRAWLFLGVSSLGAVLCLFLALVLVARLLRALGITSPDGPGD